MAMLHASGTACQFPSLFLYSVLKPHNPILSSKNSQCCWSLCCVSFALNITLIMRCHLTQAGIVRKASQCWGAKSSVKFYLQIIYNKRTLKQSFLQFTLSWVIVQEKQDSSLHNFMSMNHRLYYIHNYIRSMLWIPDLHLYLGEAV